ncbi:hypothetical protein CLOM_g2492 [Closterium sp. NIES-68]|nr:hypothetical protein CLOM_g2492 [Closterium sp. NIES-68]
MQGLLPAYVDPQGIYPMRPFRFSLSLFAYESLPRRLPTISVISYMFLLLLRACWWREVRIFSPMIEADSTMLNRLSRATKPVTDPSPAIPDVTLSLLVIANDH